jgi:hypothetical protein
MIKPPFPRQPPDSGDPPPTYGVITPTSLDSDSDISKRSVFPKAGKIHLTFNSLTHTQKRNCMCSLKIIAQQDHCWWSALTVDLGCIGLLLLVGS